MAAFWVTARVVGTSADGADQYMGHKTALLYNNAGNLAIRGNTELAADVETDAGFGSNIAVSGDNVLVIVTGSGDSNMMWACTLDYQSVVRPP